VHWKEVGGFSWDAAYSNGSGIEHGHAIFLTPPIMSAITNDGKWEAHYFAGTRFIPGNVTTCCCEYVGNRYTDAYAIMTDYCPGKFEGSFDVPIWKACEPYVTTCPDSNISAFHHFGSPVIEVYTNCTLPGRKDKEFLSRTASLRMRLAHGPWPALVVTTALGSFVVMLSIVSLMRKQVLPDRDPNDYACFGGND
jgi:hypothetical protein